MTFKPLAEVVQDTFDHISLVGLISWCVLDERVTWKYVIGAGRAGCFCSKAPRKHCCTVARVKENKKVYVVRLKLFNITVHGDLWPCSGDSVGSNEIQTQDGHFGQCDVSRLSARGRISHLISFTRAISADCKQMCFMFYSFIYLFSPHRHFTTAGSVHQPAEQTQRKTQHSISSFKRRTF